MIKTCTVASCTDIVHAKKLCNRHYKKNIRYGNPNAGYELRIIKDDKIPEFPNNKILKPIPGLEGRYSASNDGYIWSHIANKFLNRFVRSRGYLYVGPYINGSNRSRSVHRLVALAWIPNPNNYPQINHISGIRNDNRIENLEWVTGSLNILHAVRINLKKVSKLQQKIASKLGKATRKLTYEQAKEIRNLNLSGRKIAALYGVSKRCIQFIKNNKTYTER